MRARGDGDSRRRQRYPRRPAMRRSFPCSRDATASTPGPSSPGDALARMSATRRDARGYPGHCTSPPTPLCVGIGPTAPSLDQECRITRPLYPKAKVRLRCRGRVGARSVTAAAATQAHRSSRHAIKDTTSTPGGPDRAVSGSPRPSRAARWSSLFKTIAWHRMHPSVRGRVSLQPPFDLQGGDRA